MPIEPIFFAAPSTPGPGGGPSLYFGLAATNSTDGRQAIEFFDPQNIGQIMGAAAAMR